MDATGGISAAALIPNLFQSSAVIFTIRNMEYLWQLLHLYFYPIGATCFDLIRATKYEQKSLAWDVHHRYIQYHRNACAAAVHSICKKYGGKHSSQTKSDADHKDSSRKRFSSSHPAHAQHEQGEASNSRYAQCAS